MRAGRIVVKRVSQSATLRERLDHYAEPFVSGRCRLWLGHKRGGYGLLRWQGRHQQAHRLAYIEHVGPIPEGLDALHRCDVRACINHEHLFLGTDADNAADSVAKGRRSKTGPRGERNSFAKLTASKVLAIRDDPRSQPVIAAAYGVAQSTVSRIKRRKTWKHLVNGRS